MSRQKTSSPESVCFTHSLSTRLAKVANFVQPAVSVQMKLATPGASGLNLLTTNYTFETRDAHFSDWYRPNPDSVWSQAELQKLLSAKRLSIAEVMHEFGVCNQGKPIQMVGAAEIGRAFRLPQRFLAINANIELVRRQK